MVENSIQIICIAVVVFAVARYMLWEYNFTKSMQAMQEEEEINGD